MTTPPEEPPKRRGMSRRANIIAGIVFTVMFVCCLGAIQGWWWDSEPDEASVTDQAENVCYDAVLDELKAPSTADLVNISAYPDGDDHWIVNGSVDAENSFGAMLRSEFTCDLEQSGDQWQIISVEIT